MTDVTLAFEDANSKLLDVVSVADVDAGERVDDSLVEILKLMFWRDSPPSVITITIKLQYYDQNSGSKSLPNLSFKISTKLSSTCCSALTLTTPRSFELASSKARVTSVKSTKQQLVSQ